MTSPFSYEEKRFVLAEIIKASEVDLEHLVLFIRGHGIKPDWFNMELPQGRTANQCIEVARSLSVLSETSKRKSSPFQVEASAKRPARDILTDQGRHRLPPAHGHHLHSLQAGVVPPMSHVEPRVQPPPSTVDPPPKKRGRPSRADKAKRDLRPMLPIAPRPTQQVPGLQGPNGERYLLPAMSPSPSARTISPPSVYRMSRGSIDSQQEQLMGRTPSGDAMVDGIRPRILTEGFAEEITRDGRPVLPSPFRDPHRPRTASYSAISDRGLLSPKSNPTPYIDRRYPQPHDMLLSRSAP